MAGRGRFVSASLAWALLALLTSSTASADDPMKPEDAAFFESKVRPLLVEHCYSCHSAEAKVLRGGLLLDTKAGWEQGGDSGPSITPGDLEDSLFITAIRHDDPLMKMPPKGKMPAEAIEDLEEWVRRGAPDPRTGPAAAPPSAGRVIDLDAAKNQWPFTPLAKVDPPTPADPAWARNEIDRFLRARQEEKGVTPAPEADRRVLLRRATLDLTGLPPTPEEVAAFEADPDPLAYEKRVDRLLESPHYGERWARLWLDLARYAESHGFEHDYDRPTAYTYRDFVIKALNDDLPYDTFVKWQLAGDELAPDTPMAQMATGFLGAGVHSTQITAATVEKERYDELDDMLNTTGTAFLGMTIGCARCHDHKFDPIPVDDYYRLLSVFTKTVRSEVDLALDPAGDAAALAKFKVEHAPYADALAKFVKDDLPGRLAAWESAHDPQADSAAYPWTVLDLSSAVSRGGAVLEKQPDGSVLATGAAPDHETYVLEAEYDGPAPIAAVRLEALAHPSLVQGGPGRASNGNFALTDLEIVARPLNGPGDPVTVKLVDPRATFEQSGLPVAAAIDGDGTSGWAVDPQFGKDHAAAFRVAEPVAIDGGVKLTFTLRFANNLKHAIARPRLSVGTDPATIPLDASSFPQAVARTLATPAASRTPEQTSALLSWFRDIDPEFKRLSDAEKAHAATTPKPQVVKAMICSEGLPAIRLHTQGADFLEKTHHLKRGDPSQKQGEATPGFLRVLMSGPETNWLKPPPEGWRTSYSRAGLASWMSDTDQGAGTLLARVIVNRLWQHHYGRGLVATPSDFGTQGSPPSDPELLDWLASELIRNGWRLKPIHRLMMTSAAYRQNGDSTPANFAADPDNTFVYRMAPRRLEAESIRDSMLAVSGLLDPTMYGPGTLDERMKRRSIYFAIKRSQLIPMMSLFDAPDATVPIAVRAATTVAPQSLYLMNSPVAREWAEGLASRITEAEDEPSRIRRAYSLAFQRDPTGQELADGLAFLASQSAAYGGPAALDARKAALADYCQVLLGLNEFVFVE